MKYILFSIAAIVSTFSIGQAPVFDWVRQIKGAESEFIKDIATDDNGNVYATGYFKGSADFNPNGTAISSTSVNWGMFVKKLSPTGDVIWVQFFESSGVNRAEAIAVNDQGVVITGECFGTIDFDPGTPVVEYTGFSDAFVLKLNLDGNFQWVKTVDSGVCKPTKIELDDSGNIYYAGGFSGSTDFDPGVGVSNHSSVGNTQDLFFSKLTANGDFVWAKSIVGFGINRASSMDVSGAGDMVVGGTFQDTIDVDPGAGTNEIIAQANTDGFLLHLDTDGNYQWAYHLYGQGQIDVNAVTIDVNGNVDFTANVLGNVVIPDGVGTFVPYGGTLAQYWGIIGQYKLSSGELTWLRELSGQESVLMQGITSGDDGDLYLTGMAKGPTYWAQGGIIASTIEADTSFVLYTASVDDSGDFLWSRTVKSGLSDQSQNIALGNNDAVYTSGYFYESLDFDQGNTGTTLLAHNNTYSDAFLMKLKHPMASVNTQEAKPLSIYPNPTSDLLFVQGLEKTETVRVINSLGQTVFTGKSNNSIDVSSLNPGVYFLRLFEDDQQRVFRFIKK